MDERMFTAGVLYNSFYVKSDHHYCT